MPPTPLDNRRIPALGMTHATFLEAGRSTITAISEYYTSLATRPVLPSITPGYLRNLLPSTPPTRGENWETISADIPRTILPGITHWQSPRFMAFFAASSTFPGILGELWSAALTAPAFNWICSPAVTELETIVLDWMAQILRLPEEFHSASGRGGGVIQGSASEAVVTVMVAARERFVRRQLRREGLLGNGETDASGRSVEEQERIEDRACVIRASLVALASDQTHSSAHKASNIAGTRFRTVRTRVEDGYALTGEMLRARILALQAKGLQPYFVVGSIGTTATCAVDDFGSLESVREDFPDLWIHCDAAYAGAALVLPEFQDLSALMRIADSFDVNMHKWLLTNFDASCLYVRERGDLISALGISPAYLRNAYSESGLVTDYRDWQIPLGRRFRALKIWFVIRTWGVEGLREHIRHHLRLGELFVGLVEERKDLFGIFTQPRFGLTVLTVNARRGERGSGPGDGKGTQHARPSEEDLQATNAMTKAVHKIVEERKDFFLTATVVDGVDAIRVVPSNPLAEEKYVREAFNHLVSVAEEVFASKGL